LAILKLRNHFLWKLDSINSIKSIKRNKAKRGREKTRRHQS